VNCPVHEPPLASSTSFVVSHVRANLQLKKPVTSENAQPQLLWNAKMVIATVQRILITTVIGIVRIPPRTHGLLEKVVDMHAESHVASVRV
jgi:hypothetical protein